MHFIYTFIFIIFHTCGFLYSSSHAAQKEEGLQFLLSPITQEQRKYPYEWRVSVPAIKEQIKNYKELYRPFMKNKMEIYDIRDEPLEGLVPFGKQAFSHAFKGIKYQWQLSYLQGFWQEFKHAIEEKCLTVTLFQNHVHRLTILCNPSFPSLIGVGPDFFSPSLLQNNKWVFLKNYPSPSPKEGYNLDFHIPSCFKAILFSKKGEISIPTLSSCIYAFEVAPIVSATFALYPSPRPHNGLFTLPSNFFIHDHFHMYKIAKDYRSYPFIYRSYKKILDAVHSYPSLTETEIKLVENSIHFLTHELAAEYSAFNINPLDNILPRRPFWDEIIEKFFEPFVSATTKKFEKAEKDFKKLFSHAIAKKLQIDSTLIQTHKISSIKNNDFQAQITFSSFPLEEKENYSLYFTQDLSLPNDSYGHAIYYGFNKYKITDVTSHPISKNPTNQSTFYEFLKRNLFHTEILVSGVYDYELRDWINLYHDSYQHYLGFTPEIDLYPTIEHIGELLKKMCRDAGKVIDKVLPNKLLIPGKEEFGVLSPEEKEQQEKEIEEYIKNLSKE